MGTIGAVAEAVLLLERGGADVDAVRDALSEGLLTARSYNNMARECQNVILSLAAV